VSRQLVRRHTLSTVPTVEIKFMQVHVQWQGVKWLNPLGQ